MIKSEQNALDYAWGSRDFLNFFLRYKTIIGLSCLISIAIVLAKHYSTPNVYSSNATFIIENQTPGLSEDRATLFPLKRPFTFYEQIIKSQGFLSELQKKAHSDSIISVCWRLKGAPTNEELAKSILLKPAQYADILTLSVHSENIHVAYHLAIISADLLKSRCRAIEQEESHNILLFIKNQQAILLDKIQETDRSIEILTRGSNLPVNVNDINSSLQTTEKEYIAAHIEYELAKASLTAIDREMQGLHRVQKVSDLYSSEKKSDLGLRIDSLQSVSSELSMARVWPDSLLKIDQERDRLRQEQITHSLSRADDVFSRADRALSLNQLKERRAQEELSAKMLQARLAFLQNMRANNHLRASDRSTKEQLDRLLQSKLVYQEIFNYLIRRGEEAHIKAETSTGGIRVFDLPNLPQKPEDRILFRRLMTALYFGLGIGLGLAFIWNHFKNVIHSEEDVVRMLRTPVLGFVPKFNAKEKSLIEDCYHGLCINIQFNLMDASHKTIVVTSALPNEGKSITACNLAVNMAEIGKRTLLIDADFRKPRQHAIFRVPLQPGLTDYLVGDLRLDQVLHRPLEAPFDLLTAGMLIKNPLAVLMSAKWKSFLSSLEEIYDYILLDTSPVMTAATEPILISSMAKNVIFIVRSGKTNWQAARKGLQKLVNGDVKAQIVGCIVNDLSFRREDSYHHYYDKSYARTEETVKINREILDHAKN